MQQQLSWLHQQSSGTLPELDEAEFSLATVKETGPSTKQTAADTLGMITIISHNLCLLLILVSCCPHIWQYRKAIIRLCNVKAEYDA